MIVPREGTPLKTNMTMENPPVEDVFPLEHGRFSNVILVFMRVITQKVVFWFVSRRYLKSHLYVIFLRGAWVSFGWDEFHELLGLAPLICWNRSPQRTPAVS